MKYIDHPDPSTFRVRAADLPWNDSPCSGVRRKMIERSGGEVAVATSIVEYSANATFHHHRHDLGEELFVLEGVFSDQYGDYPAGSYVRNPPGSSHDPFSRSGCVIFVRLRQMKETDDRQVHIQSRHSHDWKSSAAGNQELLLYSSPTEIVQLFRVDSGKELQLQHGPGGLDLLLVEGAMSNDRDHFSALTWMRLSDESSSTFRIETQSLILVKRYLT